MSSADVAHGSTEGDGGAKTLFDVRPHRISSRWTKIYVGINMHFAKKPYNYQRGFFQGQASEGRPLPPGVYDVEAIRLGKRSEEITAAEQASDTQEYTSLIDTFWRTHTVDGEEMKRLEATGEYTEDEINRLARGGKLRGHIPGVGRVLPSRATSRPRSRVGWCRGSGGCGDADARVAMIVDGEGSVMD
ncbi:hypothetical protein Tco_0575129 [Tanacetum coccineum]